MRERASSTRNPISFGVQSNRGISAPLVAITAVVGLEWHPTTMVYEGRPAHTGDNGS
jgi:hypothetical protein